MLFGGDNLTGVAAWQQRKIYQAAGDRA